MPEPPFADLPAVVLSLVPDARRGAATGEPRADCARCPLVRETAPSPWSFAPDVRCCTHHPRLPNFLAGRALMRSDQGSARIRARLAEVAGVDALGIAPPPAYLAREGDGRDFGRAEELRCPFYVGGEHACGIWRDRPGSCRGWFCRHDGGRDGAVAWRQLGATVDAALTRVARRLVELGEPPTPGSHAPAIWERWYRWCGERVDGLTAAEIDAADPAPPRAPSVAASRPASAPPTYLVPAITDFHRDGERVLLAGYSTYDAVVAPASVFAFLAALDGATSWLAALTAAPGMTAELVAELYRVGALTRA